jgi:cellulose synthase/poly-beta-1,6-N-acetylglucosamine synthase-like glycosyltransferase
MSLAFEILDIIGWCITIFFGAIYVHKVIFIIVGLLFKPPKFKPAKKKYRFALICSARNEEKVIGNLLDSMLAQDYPKRLFDIIVVADNCTDKTAEICRGKGCRVYERFNDKKIGKGYALTFLFECLKTDLKKGIKTYDAYFVFDADNLLTRDYISKMNDSFNQGRTDKGKKFDIISSFRATKNFGKNVISACYGINFYQEMMIRQRPSAIMGLSSFITGTGYMVAASILKDGWQWTEITEDIELTTTTVGAGGFIGFNNYAVFFDEQPIKLSVMWKQQKRWAKGWFMVFRRYFIKNLALILGRKRSLSQRVSLYDITVNEIPYFIFYWNLFYGIFRLCMCNYLGGFYAVLIPVVLGVAGFYASTLLLAVLACLYMRKQIHCNLFKTLIYCLFFPLYVTCWFVTYFVAMFIRVKWEPIEHTDTAKITEFEE